MDTKSELIAEIDELLNLIRTRSNSVFSLILLPQKFAEKISEFTTKCIDLKKRILVVDDNSGELFDLSKEYFDLEIWAKRRVAKNNLLPTVMGLYLGFALIFTVLHKVDLAKFISETLGVAAPEKLVTLGIAGAFVYLATSLLSNVQTQNGDNQLRHVIDITIRLSLAIVVPIILVVLFFKPDGSIGDVTLSPEVLSFACGYSAKLVVDIFNKIVEKASKMIEAI